jgi:branched-chain amino acid transport system substrate-binding protein
MKMGYVLAEYAALAPAVHQITTIICFSYAYEKNNVPHNNITTIAKTITMGILRMNMKGKALLAGCIALAFSTMAQAEIKVAVVGAMSGPVAQYGDQEFTGAEQAVADINAKGGIKGEKLQIVKYDDACDPKQAVAVANKVVNDGIKYVIGHLCSSSTQPASDIYEDEGILMITPAATAPELTARGYKLLLRTTGLDSDQGPTAAKYIVEKVKPQRIAIVHDKQQYGEGLARAVQDNLKKANANVVFYDGITEGEKDFTDRNRVV